MYARIALGNVRKSFRDFSVFFLTLAFGVCVFYAFGSVREQTAVIDLASDQRRAVEEIVGILGGVSVFVLVILGFLVVYANRFLIRRRKREFGIYLTLGMDLSHVSLIIVVETLAVGVGALAAGLVLGVGLSQLMMYVTARLFEATISGFAFVFSPAACLLTIACFATIFLVTLAFNVLTVSRYKLIDLINADKVTEQVKLRSLPVSVVLFVVSLALIGVAYRTLLVHGMLEAGPYFGIATALVTVGTLLFFFSLSGFLLRLVQSSKRVYLSGLNMFTLRQLNSRINTAWLSISLVCAMLFLAVCSVCTGFSVASGLNESARRGSTYDASLYDFPSGISKHYTEGPAADDGYDMLRALRRDVPDWDELVSAAAQVNLYGQGEGGDELPTMGQFTSNTDYAGNALMTQALAGSDTTPLNVVRVSQYNALRALAGEEPVDLGQDGCLLWVDTLSLKDFWSAATEQNPTVSIWGRELTFVGTRVVDTALTDGSGGRTTGVLVVPDDAVPTNEMPRQTYLNVSYNGTREDVEPHFNEALDQAYGGVLYTQDDGVFPWPVFSYTTAASTLAEASGTTVMVSYLAIYIGFVLLVSCAAVLALQQLSEAADNVGRYRLLLELGAERRMVNRALFVQVGIYFLFPLVVAVAHAAVALSVVNDIVFLMTGFQIGTALIVTVGFVVVLYGGYFLVTYFTSKGMLLRGHERG